MDDICGFHFVENCDDEEATLRLSHSKNRFQKATQQKKGRTLIPSPLLGRKSGQHGSKLGSEIDQKSINIDAKIDRFFDASWGRFLKDFGGFWKAKWSQVGTKIDQKSMPIAKCDFLKNRALAAAGARFLRFWESKLGVKID